MNLYFFRWRIEKQNEKCKRKGSYDLGRPSLCWQLLRAFVQTSKSPDSHCRTEALPPCFRESSHGDGGILNPVISQPSTHWSITKKQEPAHLSQGECRVTRSTFHQHAAQPVCTSSKLTGLYIDRTASFPKGKGHAPLPTTPLENRANSVRSTHCKCQHPGKETQTRIGILQWPSRA